MDCFLEGFQEKFQESVQFMKKAEFRVHVTDIQSTTPCLPRFLCVMDVSGCRSEPAMENLNSLKPRPVYIRTYGTRSPAVFQRRRWTGDEFN